MKTAKEFKKIVPFIRACEGKLFDSNAYKKQHGVQNRKKMWLLNYADVEKNVFVNFFR